MKTLFYVLIGILIFQIPDKVFSEEQTRFEQIIEWYYSDEAKVPTKIELLGLKRGYDYHYRIPNEADDQGIYCDDRYDEFFDQHSFACYNQRFTHKSWLFKNSDFIEEAMNVIKKYDIKFDLSHAEVCVDQIPYVYAHEAGVQCYRMYKNKLIYIVKDAISYDSITFPSAKIIRAGGFNK